MDAFMLVVAPGSLSSTTCQTYVGNWLWLIVAERRAIRVVEVVGRYVATPSDPFVYCQR